MSPRAAAKPATKAAAKPATARPPRSRLRSPPPRPRRSRRPRLPRSRRRRRARRRPGRSGSPTAATGAWRRRTRSRRWCSRPGRRGIDGVEFDVRLSRDGVPVLLHDETLERVQGRDEAVADLTAAELREAGIPSLAEVLAALPPEAFLDVELKGPGHAKATADALRAGRGKAPERAVVSSFDEASLAAMAKALPDWPRWLNAVALGRGCRRAGDAPRLSRDRGPVEGRHRRVAQARRRRRPRGRRVDGHAATDRRAAGRARGDRRVRRRARARWLAAPSAAATPRGSSWRRATSGRRSCPRTAAASARSSSAATRSSWAATRTGCAGAATRWRRSPAASAHGRFSFRGRDHQLPLGMPPHAIHGVVWDRPWRVDDATTLSIDLDDRWPYRGRVVQRFALDARLDDVRAHPRGRRADARHDRLAPLVPAHPRARRPAGGRRLRRRRDARPGRRGPAHGRAGRRRHRAPGTTRSPASTATRP